MRLTSVPAGMKPGLPLADTGNCGSSGSSCCCCTAPFAPAMNTSKTCCPAQPWFVTRWSAVCAVCVQPGSQGAADYAALVALMAEAAHAGIPGSQVRGGGARHMSGSCHRACCCRSCVHHTAAKGSEGVCGTSCRLVPSGPAAELAPYFMHLAGLGVTSQDSQLGYGRTSTRRNAQHHVGLPVGRCSLPTVAVSCRA